MAGSDRQPVAVGKLNTPRLPNDRITVAPGVLLTVVRLAAQQVNGVARIGNTPGRVNRRWHRGTVERGVQVLIESDVVTIDVYLVAHADANLRQVSYNVQKQVARNIQENVGMAVGAVNVHIEDVIFDPL